MLRVKTKISESNIHGTGLFADEDIKKGQVIWRYQETTADVFSFENFLQKCSELDLAAILGMMHYSYIKDQKVVHVLHDEKYINHSLTPNVKFLDWKTEVAIKDIRKGEEILENYLDSYDPNDFFLRPELFQFTCQSSLLNELRKLHVNSANFY